MGISLFIKKHRFVIPLFSSLIALNASTGFADETELYFYNDASNVNTNVLFVLDASGSMAWTVPGGDRSRMSVMQEAFRDVLSTAPSNLNIGLIHYANTNLNNSFGWSSIKGVTFPISHIDADANSVIGAFQSTDNLPNPTGSGMPVRAFLSDVVDSWTPAGYTPIVDALYEATRYWRGETVVWGNAEPHVEWAAHPASYGGTTSCTSSHDENCRQDLGACNNTARDCADETVHICNNYSGTAEEGSCEFNESTETPTIMCTHTICDTTSGLPTYKSPMEYSCQANFMVLMSDGRPEYTAYSHLANSGTWRYPSSVTQSASYDFSQVWQIKPDLDLSKFPILLTDLLDTTCIDEPDGFKSGRCGPELTRFLIEEDQNDTLEGKQTVQTFTVAFGLEDEPAGTNYLASLATAEDGAYTATSLEELKKAFEDVFSNVQKKSYSFSSPAFTVDSSQILSHGSDVFVPVFDVSRQATWSGNLRKYQLDSSGRVVGNSAGGSKPAFTEDGSLDETVTDLWSTDLHGNDVTLGGAAHKLPDPSVRTLWTDNGSALVGFDSTNITTGMLTPATRTAKNSLIPWVNDKTKSCWGKYTDCDGAERNVAGNMASGEGCVDVAAVTTCPAEAISETDRTQLINFARGYENGDSSANEQRFHLGDMLNTKPIVVNYGDGTVRVIIATNEGFVHSINADTGVEEWAYMPQPLLKNLNLFLQNPNTTKHIYGVDGQPALVRIDKNRNGIIEASEGDAVYVLFGLRRGGRAYYALDITSPNAPSLKWKIDSATSGFDKLGETWSKPTLSRWREEKADGTGSELVDVLVFGGGYDPNKDQENIADRAADQWGQDVYVVSLSTGELLWSLKKGYNDAGALSGASELTHSVPNDIRILDMDGNGALDRLYFADTGGNLWRVDMDIDVKDGGDTYYDYNKAQLTKLASLGGGSNAQDHRKFFYEPDVAMRLHNGKPMMTIAIGSGYRTHPTNLSAVEDRFYVIIDQNVYKAPDTTTFTTLTDSNLKDVSSIEEGKTILDYPDYKGWYQSMEFNGEKVLAPALTFLDKVLFNSFAMTDAEGAASVVSECAPATNTSRAYVLDLLSGRAVADLDGVTDEDGDTHPDRFKVAGTNELLDAPQLVFGALKAHDGSDCKIGDCQQIVQIRIGKLQIPLLDLNNTVNTDDATYSEMIDVTRLLPRLYWLDHNVTGVGNAAATTPTQPPGE